MTLPGTTYLVTRKTTQGFFYLLPGRMTNQVFRYCLARAVALTGVQIHAYCVMSNHYHVVLTDPLGLVPKFSEELNKMVARCMNALLGRHENFWASGVSPSYVRLEERNAIEEKTVYTLANPVQAGLVSHGSQWPGERLWQPGVYTARRPKGFFSANMPKSIPFEIHPLPGTEKTDPQGKGLMRLVALRESEIRESFRESGRTFMGARKVKKQRHRDSAKSATPRGNLSPTVATRDKWKRIEALQALKWFREAYKAALEAWRLGNRKVKFPPGTYAMRIFHGAKLEAT